jgi:multicomponent Na+:H+ antiporter subunit D
LVLRLWVDLFGDIADMGAATLLGALGTGAVVWGSWRAFRAERLKLLAAYSTVAQVGYLFLFFPLLAGTPATQRQDLLGAVVLLALTHGFAKAGLFLSAGLLHKAAGHDRIDDLGPSIQSLPAVALAIGLAGVALVGLPPSGTFIAKWVLLSSAIGSGQWWWIPAVVLGTLLASAYVFRVLANAFEQGPRHGSLHDARGELAAAHASIGGLAQAVPLLMTLVAVAVLGLEAEPIWNLLQARSP